MFKNKKPLTLPLISHSLSLSLSFSGRLSLYLPHGYLSPPSSPSQPLTSFFSFTASPPSKVRHSYLDSPPSSPSRPLHHLQSSIQIWSRLFLLLHGLSITSTQIWFVVWFSFFFFFFRFRKFVVLVGFFCLALFGWFWFGLISKFLFFEHWDVEFDLVFRLDFFFFVVLIWVLGFFFFFFFLRNLWFWFGFSG